MSERGVVMEWGRSSFKLGNWVAQGNEKKAEQWVDFNQRLFNRDEVWFRVFKENMGWSPIAADKGMFGSPPRDPGIWDFNFLRNHWDREEKKSKRVEPEHLTGLNKRVTEWFFRTSASTGCAFELCIIATLKGEDHVGNGHIDQIIRTELQMFDELQEKYPNAKIKANACNEFDAHDVRTDPWGRRERLDLRTVNMWAVRRNRDKYGFLDFIVDHGGRDEFDYEVGGGRETYDWGMLHVVRTKNRWWEAPPIRPIKRACNGRPYGSTESMYYVQHEDRERAATWYRNPAGWQTDVQKQMSLYLNLQSAGFSYIIIHDEKGAQCDVEWPRRETRLENELANYFGGSIVSYKFERIINQAYNEILGRPPDPGGLEHYNGIMHLGTTEQQVRESMIRSAEYDNKNPEEGEG